MLENRDDVVGTNVAGATGDAGLTGEISLHLVERFEQDRLDLGFHTQAIRVDVSHQFVGENFIAKRGDQLRCLLELVVARLDGVVDGILHIAIEAL